tara:strand:- start:38 stop:247 length:210 start_codon:yes stop_codon:yes gene_type:complete
MENKVNKITGNSEGCTHVRELLVSLATVAFQTIHGEKSRQTREALSKKKTNPFSEKKWNACFIEYIFCI